MSIIPPAWSPPRLTERLINWLPAGFRADPIILDVGSLDAAQAREFAEVFPKARIYAVEPNPASLIKCRENAIPFPNITVVEGATNAFDGESVLYAVDAANPGASSLLPASGHNEIQQISQTPIKVNSFRLDAWAHREAIDRFDIVWLKLQGMELPSLLGMGTLLKSVQALQVQIYYRELYDGQHLWPEIRDFLLRNELFLADEWPDCSECFGNAIFTKHVPASNDSFPADKPPASVTARGALHCLRYCESKVYSQNGEDGVIRAILNSIGETNRCCVEFGVEDGSECNTRLLVEQGWRYLWMDCVGRPSRFQIRKEWVNAETIVPLLKKYGIPERMDCMSIDTDFNDLYILNALLHNEFRPRLLIVEYNAACGPVDVLSVRYNPFGNWTGTNYFGASLAAFAVLCKQYDYRLVYCESNGSNAFFVPTSLVSGEYLRSTAELWRPPAYPEHAHDSDNQMVKVDIDELTSASR